MIRSGLKELRRNRIANVLLTALGVLLVVVPQVIEIARVLGASWVDVAAAVFGSILLLVVQFERLTGIDLDGDGKPAPPSSQAPCPWWLTLAVLALSLLGACGGRQSPSNVVLLDSVFLEMHGCADGTWYWTPETGAVSELSGSGSVNAVVRESVCLLDMCIDLGQTIDAFVSEDRASVDVCFDALDGFILACPIEIEVP